MQLRLMSQKEYYTYRFSVGVCPRALADDALNFRASTEWKRSQHCLQYFTPFYPPTVFVALSNCYAERRLSCIGLHNPLSAFREGLALHRDEEETCLRGCCCIKGLINASLTKWSYQYLGEIAYRLTLLLVHKVLKYNVRIVRSFQGYCGHNFLWFTYTKNIFPRI